MNSFRDCINKVRNQILTSIIKSISFSIEEDILSVLLKSNKDEEKKIKTASPFNLAS